VGVQGQKYPSPTELRPAYIAGFANSVDHKMQLAAGELHTSDAIRVAVIAALNLADELFRARAAGAGLEQRVLDRTTEIERLVDAALGNAAAAVRIENAG